MKQVYATLEGLFTALDIGQWDYIVNLSGSDYPLCSDSEFKSRLGANNNYDMTFKLCMLHILLVIAGRELTSF